MERGIMQPLKTPNAVASEKDGRIAGRGGGYAGRSPLMNRHDVCAFSPSHVMQIERD